MVFKPAATAAMPTAVPVIDVRLLATPLKPCDALVAVDGIPDISALREAIDALPAAITRLNSDPEAFAFCLNCANA